jgi:hypothetical protein
MEMKNVIRQAIRAMSAAALAVTALGATGCVSRKMLSFEDHPSYPVTDLEVFETRSYFVYATHEHQFFSCADAGDKLVCKRTCGGQLDIQCPNDVSTSYGGKTNVR